MLTPTRLQRPLACLALLSVSMLVGCAASHQVAGAISGRPYVPTAADRAQQPIKEAFAPVPPAEGKAVIYFYRNSQFLAAGRDYTVSLNGTPKANIPSGSYVRVEVEPQQYKILARPTTLAMLNPPIDGEIELAPNEVRYVLIAIGAKSAGQSVSYKNPKLNQNFWSSDNSLQLVSAADAVGELSRIGPSQ